MAGSVCPGLRLRKAMSRSLQTPALSVQTLHVRAVGFVGPPYSTLPLENSHERSDVNVYVASFGDPRFTLEDAVAMYRLRDEAFRARLGWAVGARDGLEFDEYDEPPAHYVIAKDDGGVVRGCWRLLPTADGRYMLPQRFGHLLDSDAQAPRSPAVWEISRFTASGRTDRSYGFTQTPLQMMRVAVEFARERGITQYVAVTTPAIERLLQALGVPAWRFGAGSVPARAQAVVLCIEIDDRLDRALRTRHHRPKAALPGTGPAAAPSQQLA